MKYSPSLGFMTQLTSKLKSFEEKPRNASDHVGAQLRAIHLFRQWIEPWEPF